LDDSGSWSKTNRVLLATIHEIHHNLGIEQTEAITHSFSTLEVSVHAITTLLSAVRREFQPPDSLSNASPWMSMVEE